MSTTRFGLVRQLTGNLFVRTVAGKFDDVEGATGANGAAEANARPQIATAAIEGPRTQSHRRWFSDK
jgi:hypothetical protein